MVRNALSTIIATQGPCIGHCCDNCFLCTRGSCCRKDMPDYNLPTFGDWQQQIFGEIGVLAQDGDKIECHICGNTYRSLPKHIFMSHGIWTDEYKIYFGLNKTIGLVGRSTSAKLTNNLLERRRNGIMINDGFHYFTEEQCQEVLRRPKSRQAILNMERAAKARGANPEFGQKISKTKRSQRRPFICQQCGESFLRENHNRSKEYCSNECGNMAVATAKREWWASATDEQKAEIERNRLAGYRRKQKNKYH